MYSRCVVELKQMIVHVALISPGEGFRPSFEFLIMFVCLYSYLIHQT